jgi:hypothetical protein
MAWSQPNGQVAIHDKIFELGEVCRLVNAGLGESLLRSGKIIFIMSPRESKGCENWMALLIK